MDKFKDFKKKYMKDLAGATVSDAERERLIGNTQNEYMKELSGATVSDAERERLLQSMSKQKKGGMMKKASGGMVRGQGAAIRGTKFKGIF
jgi:hypothetical protein